ncbi:MAG: hypothetical protein ACREGR_04540 [Minisyncoccia bacterium]
MTEQFNVVEFVLGPIGAQLNEVTVGAVASMVYARAEEPVVDTFPATSCTAPVVICSVRDPSVFGELRETLNVYGPAPVPLDDPAVHVDEEPLIATSLVVELKPVTASLNVTEQLSDVALTLPGAGVQVKAVTVGAVLSTRK